MAGLSYEEAIQREQAFWEHFHLDALRYGIPHWLDWRRGQVLRRPVFNPLEDPRYDEILRGAERRRFLQWCREAYRPGARALDFGCGLGWLALELARMGFQVTGLDLSGRALRAAAWYAYQVAGELRGSILYREADLNRAEVEDGWDLIAIWDVLHHLEDPLALLDRLASALAPGGRLVIWDHRGLDPRALVFYRWFHYLVPAHPRMYARKILSLLGRTPKDPFAQEPAPVELAHLYLPEIQEILKGLQDEDIPDAPFEHHSEELLRTLPARFHGAESSTHLCFLAHLAHHHRLPPRGDLLLLRLLKALDDALIRNRIFEGEYFLFCWTKPNP